MSHTLRTLAILTAVLLAAPAPLAQDPSDCRTFPERGPYPPIPFPYPEGYPRTGPASPSGDERRQTGPTRSLERERSFSRTLRPAAVARGGAAECPTDIRTRAWVSGRWIEWIQASAAYDDAGRTIRHTRAYDFNGDGTLDNTVESTYEYDSEGRMLSYTDVTIEGEPIFPDERGAYTYDAEGRLLSGTTSYREDSPWQEYYRYVMSYDDGPLPTGYTFEDWDGTSWQPDSRDSFTFDGERLVQTYQEDWDGTAWAPSGRDTYTYTDGRFATYLSEDYNGTGWEPFFRIMNTFDAAGRLTLDKSQVWEEGDWVDTDSDAYTYNAGGLLVEVVGADDWDGEFGLADRERFTYEDGRLAEVLTDTYESGDWVAEHRFRYTHDGQGRIVERVQENWTGSAWVNDESNLYAYDGSVSTAGAPEAPALALTAAPNPVRGAGRLHYTLPAPAAVRLALYDVLGRRVAVVAEGARAAGPHAEALDVSRLAPGVYVLRLEAGAEALTQRLTVVR